MTYKVLHDLSYIVSVLVRVIPKKQTRKKNTHTHTLTPKKSKDKRLEARLRTEFLKSKAAVWGPANTFTVRKNVHVFVVGGRSGGH